MVYLNDGEFKLIVFMKYMTYKYLSADKLILTNLY